MKVPEINVNACCCLLLCAHDQSTQLSKVDIVIVFSLNSLICKLKIAACPSYQFTPCFGRTKDLNVGCFLFIS